MGMFIHARSGTLWLSSKTDKRWCVSVEDDAVGPYNSWFQETVDKLTEKYGPPPDDLEFGYMKD